MPLSTAQQELFKSTFLPLLAYANSRRDVVRDLPTSDVSDDDNLRFELVARALWHHLELIDDYVRDNPDDLSSEQLDIARDLRGTLYGEYFFDGSHDSLVTLIHDTGVYHAVCVDDHMADHLPNHPCTMRCALAPYRGRILLVKPLVVMGEAPSSQRDALIASINEQGLGEPTTCGETLAQRSSCWHVREKHRTQRQEEQCRHSYEIGAGYHRGALAGISEPERTLRRTRHRNASLSATGELAHRMAAHAIDATLFPRTLSEALQLLDEEWLSDLAKRLSAPGEQTPCRRDTLIAHIVTHVAANRTERDAALMWCEDGQFDLIRRLLHENPLSLMRLEPSEALKLYPMPPYTFILREKDSFVAWMPPEVLPVLSDADFDAVTQLRRRLSQAAHAADALASMCGVLPLDEAYTCYRQAVSDPLSQEHFELALIEMETCDRRDSYSLWTHEQASHLISGELSEQGVMAHIIRSEYASRIVSAPIDPDDPSAASVVLCTPDEEAEILATQLQAMRGVEETKRHLLELHRPYEPHPLVPSMLDQSFVDYLRTTESLIRLRDYVDAHLPDSEDDYEFAATFCRAVIVSALFEHEPYHDVLDVIRLFGMDRCEGDRYPHQLGKLVTDVFNALPNWQLNGWSLNENTERLTGRPVMPQASA